MKLLEVPKAMLNIDSLETGIVIDHIQAGTSMRVYDLLKLEKLDCCVAVIKKCPQQQARPQRHH